MYKNLKTKVSIDYINALNKILTEVQSIHILISYYTGCF